MSDPINFLPELRSTNAAENKKLPVRVEFRKIDGPVNFGWPGYDFYNALRLIHQYLPCGSYKDKDILVPSNFQFEAHVHYAVIASFDVAVMRVCERSYHNPTKGDNPTWRIYPTLNYSEMKLIGFEYMPINSEVAA